MTRGGSREHTMNGKLPKTPTNGHEVIRRAQESSLLPQSSVRSLLMSHEALLDQRAGDAPVHLLTQRAAFSRLSRSFMLVEPPTSQRLISPLG